MRHFLSELSRRNVLRAGLLYAGAVWAGAQGLATLTPHLGLPVWSTRAFLLASAIGLPFWLGFAWFYALTPKGLRRESEIAPEESIAAQTGRRLNYWVVAVLSLAVVLLLTDKFLLRRPEPAEPAVASATTPDIPFASIAVLPFANRSGDPAQDYFVDGLTEELISGLGRMPGLKVIGRTSSSRFSDGATPSADIGTQLGVAHLLEGSVRWQGERLRVDVNLLSAADGRSVWSQTFDRNMSDVFKVQSEIAQAVAAALRVKLAGVIVTNDYWPPSGNVEAYLAFLRAIENQRQATLAGFEGALTDLQQATRLDPGYAAAHAVGALVNFNLSMIAEDPAEAQSYEKAAVAALERANGLMPEAPTVLLIRSLIQNGLYGDLEGAAATAREAYARYPENPQAMYAMQKVLMREGKTAEAVALLDKMLAADPLRGVLRLLHAQGLMLLDRYDEAERQLQKLIALQPDYVDARISLVKLAILRGNPSTALHLAQELDESDRAYPLALALAAGGDRDAASAKLDELQTSCGGPCYWYLSELHAMLGDEQSMYADLDHALSAVRAQGAEGLPDLLTSPFMKRYWTDPRFRDFARRNGTPLSDAE